MPLFWKKKKNSLQSNVSWSPGCFAQNWEVSWNNELSVAEFRAVRANQNDWLPQKKKRKMLCSLKVGSICCPYSSVWWEKWGDENGFTMRRLLSPEEKQKSQQNHRKLQESGTPESPESRGRKGTEKGLFTAAAWNPVSRPGPYLMLLLTLALLWASAISLLQLLRNHLTHFRLVQSSSALPYGKTHTPQPTALEPLCLMQGCRMLHTHTTQKSGRLTQERGDWGTSLINRR